MKTDFLKTIPIAHRGMHGDGIPENSLSAFRAAIDAGYAIETDVRPARDGTLFLMHDDELPRMTGAEGLVSDSDPERLRGLRLSDTEEPVPLFPEFLELIGGRVPVLLEIKRAPVSDSEAYLRAIADALSDYSGAIAIQSFDPRYVKTFKRLRPDLPCGILAKGRYGKAEFPSPFLYRTKSALLARLAFNRFVKPDFISYCFSDCPNRATEKFRKLRLAWTVRTEEEAAYALRYCDNIIFERIRPPLSAE